MVGPIAMRPFVRVRAISLLLAGVSASAAGVRVARADGSSPSTSTPVVGELVGEAKPFNSAVFLLQTIAGNIVERMSAARTRRIREYNQFAML